MSRALEITALLEVFYGGFKGRWGDYIEIFVNPDKREMMDAADNRSKEVRFVADPVTKKVYIWNADSALHPEAMKRINSRWDWQRDVNLLVGTAEFSRGKLTLSYIDRLEFMSPEDRAEHLRMDWRWVDKTILVTPGIEKRIQFP